MGHSTRYVVISQKKMKQYNNLSQMLRSHHFFPGNGIVCCDVDEMEKYIHDDVGRQDKDVQQPQTMIIDDIRQDNLQQPVQHPGVIHILEEEVKKRSVERKDKSR